METNELKERESQQRAADISESCELRTVESRLVRGRCCPGTRNSFRPVSLNESYEDESGVVRRGWASVAQREKKNGEREKRGESELNFHRPRRIHLQATLWPYIPAGG